jgi:hypothetical protein
MGLQLNTNKMPEVAYANIIPALDKHFNGQWTWELADERFAQDNTTVCTTVTVYTPGRVYTGRSLCKIKDYATNHLSAILDACQTFISRNTAQPQTPVNPSPANQQMTPDQIMSALGQQAQPQTPPQQQQVRNLNELNNLKDGNGNPVEEVPFDAMSDLCVNESQQSMGMLPDYDTPQDKLKGFSQHQIDRLNQFKKDFDIMNDEMFGNYVNTWDKSLTSKKDITPANANAFLNWVENLGKTGC